MLQSRTDGAEIAKLGAGPGALPPAAETFLDRGGRPRFPDKGVAMSRRVPRDLLTAFKVDP